MPTEPSSTNPLLSPSAKPPEPVVELEAPALAVTLAMETPEPETAERAPSKPKKRRGFAAMDGARVREIAHRGGLAAHAKGTAHQFTHDEAREAGQKGGRAPHRVRGRKSTQTPAS